MERENIEGYEYNLECMHSIVREHKCQCAREIYGEAVNDQSPAPFVYEPKVQFLPLCYK